MYKIWTQKPPVGSQINWGHPLSKGLIGCWLMNEGGGARVSDIATGMHGNATGGVVFSKSLFGMSSKFNGTTGAAGNEIQIADSPNFTFTTAQSFTLASFFVPLNINSKNQNLIRHDNDSASPRHILCLRISSSNKASFFFCGNISRLPTITGGTTLVNGKLYMAVGVRDVSSDKAKLYLNGKPDSTDVTDSTAETIDVNYPMSFGGIRSGVSMAEVFNGYILYNIIWRRSLSHSEIQSLYVSPYQFIKRPASILTNLISAVGGWAHKIYGISPEKVHGVDKANVGKVYGV